jgi:cysteine desulfurase family protein (TIGR01976 family)
MPLDIAKIRAQFPALAAGAAHFDGPGGSQTPKPVADAVHATLISPIANRGSVTAAERTAERVVSAMRQAMADFANGSPRGIVFGRSMTQLTFDIARTLAQSWSVDDEVVVSRLDHDANVRPWLIAAERAGATVRWIDFDPDTTELTSDDVAAVLSDRTKLVAVTGASNLVGTRPDVAAIAALAHRAGALCYVDAVHLAAHAALDLPALGADFVVCSPYKFLGPHCGVLAADPELLERLRPDKLVPSTDAAPERFELGTLPYELMAGTTAAVDFLADMSGTDGPRRDRLVAGCAALEQHETALRTRIEDGIAAIGGIVVRSRAARRTPTLLLTFADGRPVADAYQFLAERGVNAPAGSFYAYEPARAMGLGPDGGLRVGLAPYNDDSDVDRLLDGLAAFVAS